MRIGVGLSIPELSTRGGRFSPASLFTGGVAGAWYDPSDVLLNWRTNLLTYSQEFDNAIWIKTGIDAFGSGSVVNATTAPDGTTTADFIRPGAASSSQRLSQNPATSPIAQTLTVYVKASGYNKVALKESATTGNYASFDLSSASVLANTAGVTASITADVSGWYRIRMTLATAVVGGLQISVLAPGYTTGDPNSSAFSGDGTSGIYVWGAQLELGSTATTYQAITTPEQTYLLYDPQPVLYQDSAGTTPVTAVEQPVGLMLDKSQGLVLGSELVTNGDFSSGTTTGWTAVSGGLLSVVSGQLKVENSATYGRAWQAVTVTANQWYEVRTLAVAGTANATIRFGNSGAGSSQYVNAVNTTGSFVWRFYATTTIVDITLYCESATIGATVFFDNISVKSLAGNHASQATAASRPVLRARYNLLTYSEQFNNAAWGLNAVAVTANQEVAPDGTTTADKVANSTTTLDYPLIYQNFTLSAAATVTHTVYAKVGSANFLSMGTYDGTALKFSGFNLSNGTVNVTAVGHTLAIVDAGGGWYRCSVTYAYPATTARIYVGVYKTSGTPQYIPSSIGADFIYIWGADARTGSSAGTYQRIAAATDYATAGFLPYLAFDGTDDSFGTNSINFTATDKMSVCAGVTKLSDAATAVVSELSATSGSNSGVFVLFAPGSPASKRFGFNSNGNAAAVAEAATTDTAYNAPFTAVLTGQGNISGDSVTLRANATQVGSSTADQGTGNFGNYPLFIGRRNNASLPFNGRIYQMVVCGKTLSASELAALESFTNSKTGAY